MRKRMNQLPGDAKHQELQPQQQQPEKASLGGEVEALEAQQDNMQVVTSSEQEATLSGLPQQLKRHILALVEHHPAWQSVGGLDAADMHVPGDVAKG